MQYVSARPSNAAIRNFREPMLHIGSGKATPNNTHGLTKTSDLPKAPLEHQNNSPHHHTSTHKQQHAVDELQNAVCVLQNLARVHLKHEDGI